MTRLPKGARRVLRMFLPGDWREDIQRDLEEAFATRFASDGRLRSTLWLWGQVAAFAARFVAERVREAAGGGLLTSTDVRLAVRAVRKSPGLSVLAVASLSVGIAMAVGSFVLIRGTFFMDLPFPEGDRLYVLEDYNRTDAYAVGVGPQEFLRRRLRLTSFEAIEAYRSRSVVLGDGGGGGISVSARYSTPGLLLLADTPPRVGRLPDAADVQAGAESVVVIPHGVWRALGSDPDVVGSTLIVAGTPTTVIGVMPERFAFPWGDEIWIPVDIAAGQEPLQVIAKLRDGVDVRNARAEYQAIARPDPMQVTPGTEVAHEVIRMDRSLASGSAAQLALLIPIAVSVLLLGVMATNVANLMLARNATRAGEIAVRSALGGSRLRVAGQLVLETGVMVAVAAGLALGLTRVGLDAFQARVRGLPYWADFSINAPTAAFIVAVVLLTTCVVGLLPALRVTGGNLSDALRDGSRGSSGVRFGRLTGTLIVLEIAICVGFLSSATLLGRSLLAFGFEGTDIPGSEVLVAQLYLGWPDILRDPDASLPETERADIRAEFLRESARKGELLREASLTLPGARSAVLATRFPGNESQPARVHVEASGAVVVSELAEIGEGYFELLGARPLIGRDFNEVERADRLPVAIVNEMFVRLHLAGVDPIGSLVRVVRPESSDVDAEPWRRIVGVVPSLGLNPGNPANADGVYLPLPELNVVRLAVYGDGNPPQWTPRLIELARAVDPAIEVQWSRTLEAQMREPVVMFRALGTGLLLLGVLALVLSAASLHALTSASVTRRTRELGIRQALGARRVAIVGAVARRTTAQTAAGAALGGVLALALSRLGSIFPWEVADGSAWALTAVAVLLLATNALALAQPLHRALSIRPADALRAE